MIGLSVKKSDSRCITKVLRWKLFLIMCRLLVETIAFLGEGIKSSCRGNILFYILNKFLYNNTPGGYICT